MVELELSQLEQQPELSAALATVVDAVKPMTDRLSQDLAGTLKDFLPDVTSVIIEFGH
jgi:hypothetical protein